MELGKIRVFLIDDDVQWIKKLTVLINSEDDMIVVGASFFTNSDSGFVQWIKPDIILIDAFSENSIYDGIQFIQSLGEISESKIIVLTATPEPEYVKAALFSGAKDYILKENIKLFPEVIRVVVKRWSAAEIMTQVVYAYTRSVYANRKDEILNSLNLTLRERNIYHCLERGLTRVQIAGELGISENTVKNHITRILNKVQADNSKQAVCKINNLV